MPETKTNNNLVTINELRGLIKLNGKKLTPYTEDEYVKRLERMQREKEKREQLKLEKKQKLYKMIDGKVHKISDETPSIEKQTYDNCVDYEFGFDFYYSEEESYYVTIYPHGNKDKKWIGRYFETWFNNNKTIKWTGGGYADINDDDTWEYTKEAFDYGVDKE